MSAMHQLQPYLDDLARRLDDQQEARYRQAWIDFLNDRCEEDVFVAPAREPSAPGLDWPEIPINDAIEDTEKMVLSQLKIVSDELAAGGRQSLGIRCNYGTGILPVLFGCELFMMDRELDTLPTAVPLHSREKIQQLLDAGVPDLNQSLGREVWRTAERFQEVFEASPEIARNVAVYHPDLQGPIDVAEVVWGSEIFLAILDEPDVVRNFLTLMTDTYEAFADAWFARFPQTQAETVHWTGWHKGQLMLRNDSLMNLSPQTYVELVRPFDQRLFDKFGGQGSIHFCGRGEHFIEAMSEMRGLTSIWMSQPHLNDMDVIFKNTVDKGIKLTGLNFEAVNKAGRPLKGQVHTVPAGAYNFAASGPSPAGSK